MREEPLARSRVWPAAGILAVVLVAGLVLSATLTPLVAVAGRVVHAIADVLRGSDVDLTFPRMPERSTIYAADGTVLARLFLDEHRKVVPLDRIPKRTQRAVLAVEDARFYEHRGVDPTAVARAALVNLGAGEVAQGGSTITQQVARGAFSEVGREETLARKLREARTALHLERVYSKDEILEIYLNHVYLGRGVYGIATAAEFYFARDVEDLTLAQSALLAAMIAAPERGSPLTDRAVARERRAMALDRMQELGWITPERAERAKEARLNLSPRMRPILRQARAPFFVEFIKRQILQDPTFGETRRDRVRTLFQGGLEIHTTLDTELQEAGREAVTLHLSEGGDPEGAVVAVRPGDGAIRALVGGEEFRRQQFDLASQGRRQAGSAFKTFTLVAALDAGMSPNRTYPGSSPQAIPVPGGPPWEVENAGGASYGAMNLRQATARSVNVVFARLITDVGPRRVARVAERMGIRSDLLAVPSLALGTAPVSPLEMTSAYATLANEGRHCEPHAIREVLDRDDRTVFERTRRCERAVSPRVAAHAVDILEDVMTSGTGTLARLDPWPAFGKTGTTDDHADAWFSGCTMQLCASTWVGHIEGRVPMLNVNGGPVWGGNIPAGIWREFMGEAMLGRPVRDFPDPPPPSRDRGAQDRKRSSPSPSTSPETEEPSPGPSPEDPSPTPLPSPSPPGSPSPRPSPAPSPSPEPDPDPDPEPDEPVPGPTGSP